MSFRALFQKFIYQCLIKDPLQRIGANDFNEIFNDPWFSDVNWQEVKELKKEPPIKPEIKDKYDTENFNKDV